MIVQRARLPSEQPSNCTAKGQGQVVAECCAWQKLVDDDRQGGAGLAAPEACTFPQPFDWSQGRWAWPDLARCPTKP